MIKIRVLSLDLDMKLVFPGKRGSRDLNGPPFGNDPPNLGKVLKPRFKSCTITCFVEFYLIRLILFSLGLIYIC